MASRIVEAGSIITRTRHLLLTRVLKERPLWLDVAEAFPPEEPLPPPHKARHLHHGKPHKLTFQEDALKRDFPKYYSIVKRTTGNQPAEMEDEVSSLHEDQDPNTLNLVDKFVHEQCKEISLGKSKMAAGKTALITMADYHPSLAIQHKVEVAKPATDNKITSLEHAVMDVLETLK